jgi:hypothetical protein
MSLQLRKQSPRIHTIRLHPRRERAPESGERLSRYAAGAGASVSATRNAAGQSLDDARAEFRASWQSKLERKQRAVARARAWVSALHRVTEVVLLSGGILGAAAGAALGLFSGNLAMFLEAGLLGAMIGCGATLPLAALLQLPAWILRWYAYRTETALQNGTPL